MGMLGRLCSPWLWPEVDARGERGHDLPSGSLEDLTTIWLSEELRPAATWDAADLCLQAWDPLSLLPGSRYKF